MSRLPTSKKTKKADPPVDPAVITTAGREADETFYPLDVRLQARNMYIQGKTIRHIESVLKVPLYTIVYWSRRGRWKMLRENYIKLSEETQVRAIKRQATRAITKNAKTINFVENFLMTHFYKIDPDTGETVAKTMKEFSVRSPADVVDQLLTVVTKRTELLRLTDSMMGNMTPKLDAVELNLEDEKDAANDDTADA